MALGKPAGSELSWKLFWPITNTISAEFLYWLGSGEVKIRYINKRALWVPPHAWVCKLIGQKGPSAFSSSLFQVSKFKYVYMDGASTRNFSSYRLVVPTYSSDFNFVCGLLGDEKPICVVIFWKFVRGGLFYGVRKYSIIDYHYIESIFDLNNGFQLHSLFAHS